MVKKVERAIQIAVIRHVHEHYPHIMITATANENFYTDTSQIGCLGIPDLIMFHPNGSVYFLELKRKKGKLSPSQINWSLWYRTSRFPHFHGVAYGFEEAKNMIDKLFIVSYA